MAKNYARPLGKYVSSPRRREKIKKLGPKNW